MYGHTPFSALAFIQKMHAITDPHHRIAMPALRNRALADVIQRCLDRNARTRITMQVDPRPASPSMPLVSVALLPASASPCRRGDPKPLDPFCNLQSIGHAGAPSRLQGWRCSCDFSPFVQIVLMMCAVQELLSHPFLRPTAAAAQDSLVGVTKDQLKKLLVQVRLSLDHPHFQSQASLLRDLAVPGIPS